MLRNFGGQLPTRCNSNGCPSFPVDVSSPTEDSYCGSRPTTQIDGGVHLELPLPADFSRGAGWVEQILLPFRIKVSPDHPGCRYRAASGCPRLPGLSHLEANRAVGLERPAGIVRHFPHVAVRIGERSGCASPIGDSCVTND
jgi:hypothetical protein